MVILYELVKLSSPLNVTATFLNKHIRFEWSIGNDNSSDPFGVFDSALERIWFDVGQDNHAIITLDKGKEISLFSVKFSSALKFGCYSVLQD